MALNNIEMIAQKMEGDNGPKVLVTIWADEFDWLNVEIADDTELGLRLMEKVIDAIEEGA